MVPWNSLGLKFSGFVFCFFSSFSRTKVGVVEDIWAQLWPGWCWIKVYCCRKYLENIYVCVYIYIYIYIYIYRNHLALNTIYILMTLKISLTFSWVPAMNLTLLWRGLKSHPLVTGIKCITPSSINIWLTHPSSLLISGSINIIPPEA